MFQSVVHTLFTPNSHLPIFVCVCLAWMRTSSSRLYAPPPGFALVIDIPLTSKTSNVVVAMKLKTSSKWTSRVWVPLTLYR